MNWNFQNKNLKNCKWSKDPRKRYNQAKHFYDNNQKYDLNISDMIKLSEMKKDLFKLFGKR